MTDLRGGQQPQLEVKTGLHPSQALAEAGDQAGQNGPVTPRLGVCIAPLDAALRERLRLPEKLSVVAITDVQPSSAAAT